MVEDSAHRIVPDQPDSCAVAECSCQTISHWVMEPYQHKSLLIADLGERVMALAEAKAKESSREVEVLMYASSSRLESGNCIESLRLVVRMLLRSIRA